MDRRRDPARQRHEQIGPEAQVELLDDRRERARRRPAADAAPPTRSRPARDVGKQDADLLERLADRRDVGRERRRPAAGRRPALRRLLERDTTTARPGAGPHRRHRRARPGTRACPARTPSTPADGSAGPRARRGPVASRTTVAAGRGLDPASGTRSRRPACRAARRSAAGVGDRQAAGEVAADVGRRPAVDRRRGRAAAGRRTRPRRSARRRRPAPGSAATSTRPARAAPGSRRRRVADDATSTTRRPRTTPRRATGRSRSGSGPGTARPCRSPVPRPRDSAPPRSAPPAAAGPVAAIAPPDGHRVVLRVLGPGDRAARGRRPCRRTRRPGRRTARGSGPRGRARS